MKEFPRIAPYLLVVLVVMLITPLVENGLWVVEAASSTSTNTTETGGLVSCETCNTRGMIQELKRELHDLQCAQGKIKGSIDTLNSMNGMISVDSSIGSTQKALSLRSKHLDEINESISVLTDELNVLVWKCTRFKGPNCDEGCNPGYIGQFCEKIACHGIEATDLNVCSGHGSCTSPNTCTCTYPFNGLQCQFKNITLLKDSNQIYKFGDGKIAKSCQEYRNPIHPYVYTNEGSGLYQIKPGNTSMTVYCDMETDGGGWTLFAGIRMDYKGVHFHVFDDNTAVETSEIASFHIKTEDLLSISTQIRAVVDVNTKPMSTFYSSVWAFSASCEIPSLLRSDIQHTRKVPYSSLNNYVNPDRAANCKVQTGSQVVPTHLAYCKTASGHSVGFRMGRPGDFVSQMSSTQSIFNTFTYYGAPEGGYSTDQPGVYYSAAKTWRNGALFMR